MEKYQIEFINLVRKNPFIRMFFLGCDVIDFIACQFALESDFGKSELAVKYYNFCGMKRPFKRPFYGLPVRSKDTDFAYYAGFHECCIDYISWVLYNRPYQNALENLDSYIIFLRNSGYCPERDYIDKIQSIYKQLKSYENG